MPSAEILIEAQSLHSVSEGLDQLVGDHDFVSDALVAISGDVRQSATMLEVLVVTKFGPLMEPGPSNA